MARGGFPGGMNMQNMLKQAQQMQQRVEQVEQELEDYEAEATAGGGVIKVTAGGDGRVKDIEIQPDVVDPEDVEMLQDLIIAAVNEALGKVADHRTEEMAKVTGGLNMGGLF